MPNGGGPRVGDTGPAASGRDVRTSGGRRSSAEPGNVTEASESASPLASAPHLPFSLAGASVGDEVRVEQIALGLVRSRCHDLGIAVGDRVRVKDHTQGDVVVGNRLGRPVSLPGPYAFFVYVRRLRGEDDDMGARHRSTP